MRIDDYFQKIEQIIASCPIISSKAVALDTRTEYRGILKGKLCFLNATVLYFTEVVDVKFGIDKIKYRYQYQKMGSYERIFRYDNARHHPGLPTFPHHKHIGLEVEPDHVVESIEVNLQDVLEEIERALI